jgi:hypothetical protein
MIEALSLLAVLLVGATVFYVSRITEGANDPTIQATGEGTPESVPPEFQALLDTYSRNYISHGTNKDAGSLQAYMGAQRSIDESIAALQSTADQNRQSIQTFLSNNPDTNAIEALSEQSQRLATERPKLADQQVLVSQQSPRPPPGLMSTSVILKSSLVLVSMVLMGVLNAL